MRIAIVGTGYVGLVSAACFAELGHEVIGVDIDAAKVRMLKQGKSPIYEPGLEELIRAGLKSGRLSFTTKLEEALPEISVLFSAVATPPDEGFRADLRAVFAVAEAVGKNVNHDLIFVNKSTVPVGTGAECERRIAAQLKKRGSRANVPVVSNPEFLREGMAVPDTLMPDRIIIGINGKAHSYNLTAKSLMEELYRPITRVGKPLVFMSRESAEIVKYASNAFLATKVSFINMLTELCEKTGANIRDIAKGIGLDNRIGPKFLHAGIGYGGSCFPKDVKALLATSREYGIPFPIVEATDAVNAHQRRRFIERIMKTLKKKSTVAVWGLSFKPKTDDMREAPSIDIITALVKAGHTVVAHDPVAMDRAKPLLPKQVRYVETPFLAAKGADALLVLTEWDVFRGADLKQVRKTMKGKNLFDGRNIYEPEEVREAGLQYHGIGMQ
jgi:UDPglucose 6-dehydrogenase